MLRRLFAAVALAAAGGALTSCERATAPVLPCEDEGVVLAVGGGTSPRFSWTPACLAFRIVVLDSVNAPQWGVFTDSANALSPGVTYAAVPTNAEQTQVPIALVAGRRYAVGLYRFTGPAADSGEIIAAKLFTP